MDIKGKRVLVLGGWGLVGSAVCRKLLEDEPSELIIASLQKSEAEEACEKLKLNYEGHTRLIPAGGNIFVRDSLQGLSRFELIENAEDRLQLIGDVLGDLTEEILSHSYLFQTINKNLSFFNMPNKSSIKENITSNTFHFFFHS